MEKQPDLEFQRILENIKIHFSFLIQRGYQISSVLFSDPRNENWNVVLAGDDCLIKIHCHDGKIHLVLNSIQLFNQIGWFDLHELVDLMSGDDCLLHNHRKKSPDETEQLQKAANLLDTHMDDILILFQKIHLGISFSKTGQLFADSSPVFLFREIDEAVQHGWTTLPSHAAKVSGQSIQQQ